MQTPYIVQSISWSRWRFVSISVFSDRTCFILVQMYSLFTSYSPSLSHSSIILCAVIVRTRLKNKSWLGWLDALSFRIIFLITFKITLLFCQAVQQIIRFSIDLKWRLIGTGIVRSNWANEFISFQNSNALISHISNFSSKVVYVMLWTKNTVSTQHAIMDLWKLSLCRTTSYVYCNSNGSCIRKYTSH